MALRSCYECNKEISTKAIMCPQCGAPQNPVSDLIDKAIDKAKEGGGFLQNAFKKVKNHLESEREQKEIERKIEHLEEIISSHPNENLKTLLDEKGEFGLSTTGLWGLSEIGIQELMEEMGIEYQKDSMTGLRIETNVTIKINEIRKRKKKEWITGNPFL